MKRWLRIYLVQVCMIPPSLTDYKLGNPVPKAQQDRGKRNVSRYHWCVPRHAWSSQNTHPHIIVTHSDMVSRSPQKQQPHPETLSLCNLLYNQLVSNSVVGWLDATVPRWLDFPGTQWQPSNYYILSLPFQFCSMIYHDLSTYHPPMRPPWQCSFHLMDLSK